jgi:hypothetical protein
MRSEVIVVLDGDREYRVDTQSLSPISSDEGRRWLDQQFVSLECEPLRATGKVLLADKLVVVAREARNRPSCLTTKTGATAMPWQRMLCCPSP